MFYTERTFASRDRETARVEAEEMADLFRQREPLEELLGRQLPWP